ncbi:C40 family peptidase [Candidatus Dependentiae bacterium]|nr:C40 family peptidase [Candidatus Dependentiae bacterium]
MKNNNKKYWWLLFIFNSLFLPRRNFSFPQKMIVNVAVTDLRAKPQKNDQNLKLPASDLDNPLQITQLLQGEHIIAHEKYIDEFGVSWIKINTLQQASFWEPVQWHGYPGWIQKDHASLVTDFPSHNLVVYQPTADIFDQSYQKRISLSIGTRLLGIKKIDDYWQIVLPDHSIALIKENDIYYINPIVQETEKQLRKSIIATAKKFLGSYYSWGARSWQNKDLSISNVDCSALVGLSFLAHGLQIPRMSHEQWLSCHQIEQGKDLQPGDLVFFTTITKQSTRMDHVMIYIDDNLLLEATFADEHKIRIIPFNQRLGKRPELLHSGDIVVDGIDVFQIFFGTFLHDHKLISTLRNNALTTEYDLDYLTKKNNLEDLNQNRFH